MPDVVDVTWPGSAVMNACVDGCVPVGREGTGRLVGLDGRDVGVVVVVARNVARPGAGRAGKGHHRGAAAALPAHQTGCPRFGVAEVQAGHDVERVLQGEGVHAARNAGRIDGGAVGHHVGDVEVAAELRIGRKVRGGHAALRVPHQHDRRVTGNPGLLHRQRTASEAVDMVPDAEERLPTVSMGLEPDRRFHSDVPGMVTMYAGPLPLSTAVIRTAASGVPALAAVVVGRRDSSHDLREAARNGSAAVAVLRRVRPDAHGLRVTGHRRSVIEQVRVQEPGGGQRRRSRSPRRPAAPFRRRSVR